MSSTSAFPRLARMASTTIKCVSGRVYMRSKILKAHPNNPEYSVWLATHEGNPFVLKNLPEALFKRSLELKDEFSVCNQLRMPIDYSEQGYTLIYEYFKSDLLPFVRQHENLPINDRKQILWGVGKALEELHKKDWIHLDVKPDNILVDWSVGKQDLLRVERVTLGDMDLASKLIDDQPLQFDKEGPPGNVMWRSPEAHMARGIGKASDVFSYALVCLYAIMGSVPLRIDLKEVMENGLVPEMQVMILILAFFGPLPPGLLTHINHEERSARLKNLWEIVKSTASDSHFKDWEEKEYLNLNPDTKRFILTMVNLDPAKRASMKEIMEDPWWNDRTGK